MTIGQIHKNHPGLLYKISFLFAFVAVFTFLALKLPNNSEAASLANFRPGNIISDYTMSNYESMTVAEIDKFLHDHGNCNNRETYKAAWYPSVHYHVKDGHFVCLADEVFAEGVAYGDLIPAGTPSRTAAQVIYDTAHTFKINPQVLLVLLEKEQGLISDSWPNSLQYRSATGFGCPDTAPCNELYYGFVNQLDNAAYLFRTVLDGGWTNYPLGNNYIYYNPNRACGGSNVYIENLATSSLYRYTPYQPNAAALAAGYGTVSCGAYGNRNFYLFFMDWFGDPTDTGNKPTEKQLEAEKEIDSYYNKLENASAKLGQKTVSYPNCSIGHDGACVQAYEKGIIISSKYGLLENHGEIRKRFLATGSIDGALGLPVSVVNCSIGHDGACVQAYENGVIISNPETGTWESYGTIRTRYIELGTIDGIMGFPTSRMNCSIGHDGACVQAYENGVIISSPKTGAWENYGEIRQRYINNGSVDGHFGFPTSGVVCDDDSEACYQDFEHKAIFADASGNYWLSEGEIAARYQDVDATLGAAITNINCSIGHDGACVQAFENGVIISSQFGAWESFGELRTLYLQKKSVDGELGFPTSGIKIDKTTGIQSQSFQNGTLSSN